MCSLTDLGHTRCGHFILFRLYETSIILMPYSEDMAPEILQDILRDMQQSIDYYLTL